MSVATFPPSLGPETPVVGERSEEPTTPWVVDDGLESLDGEEGFMS